MAINDLLKPRFIIGVLAIILFTGLMYTQTVGVDIGVTVIIGVLAALGVYEGYQRQINKL